MTLKIGVLMDSIDTIKPQKDSTFAMMLAAQERGHKLFYFQQSDLYVLEGIAYVNTYPIKVTDNIDSYYLLGNSAIKRLDELNVILMRKDPPFNMEYIYSTYMLEMAEKQGTLIVNPPNSLRTVNEKFYVNYFPQITPKTMISSDINKIRKFIAIEGRVVVKPMDSMGGADIFQINNNDPNINVILEYLTKNKKTIIAQTYLDKVSAGDKRILLIDGEPVKYGFLRIPQGKEFRANLAVGGKGRIENLTEQELKVCKEIKYTIKKLGLLFVGIDVIDGYITEINITSPTCIREIENATAERIADKFIAVIEDKVYLN